MSWSRYKLGNRYQNFSQAFISDVVLFCAVELTKQSCGVSSNFLALDLESLVINRCTHTFWFLKAKLYFSTARAMNLDC